LGFGTDLETLKVVSQELEDLDLELGLFGGLKVVDVSQRERGYPFLGGRRTKKNEATEGDLERELTFVFLPSLSFSVPSQQAHSSPFKLLQSHSSHFA